MFPCAQREQKSKSATGHARARCKRAGCSKQEGRRDRTSTGDEAPPKLVTPPILTCPQRKMRAGGGGRGREGRGERARGRARLGGRGFEAIGQMQHHMCNTTRAAPNRQATRDTRLCGRHVSSRDRDRAEILWPLHSFEIEQRHSGLFIHAHGNQTCTVGGRRTAGGRDVYRNVPVAGGG
jgi:hypothetical protein